MINYVYGVSVSKNYCVITKYNQTDAMFHRATILLDKRLLEIVNECKLLYAEHDLLDDESARFVIEGEGQGIALYELLSAWKEGIVEVVRYTMTVRDISRSIRKTEDVIKYAKARKI